MNVPKLRFKEFTDEWQKVPLNSFTNILGGYAFKSENLLNYKAKYQVIKMGNINNNTLNLEKNPSYLNTISQKEKPYLLKKDDIILTLTGTFGKKDFGYSYQIKDETNLLLNQRLAVFKIINSNFSSNFLKYILLNNTFLNIFFRFSVGGTGNQSNVSIQDIKSFKIPFPKIEEQKKIANFLSTVDKKISNLENIITTLENQKKGLLQQIFSQKVRFKDKNGNNYPDWEKKKLGDTLLIQRGGSPRPISDYITNDKNGLNWIKIGDCSPNSNIITSTKEKIKPEGLSKTREVFIGDLILSNSMSFGRPYILNINGCIHDGWLLLRNTQKIYNLQFLCYILGSEYTTKQYKKLAAGSTVNNLNIELVSSVNIDIPCLEEQTKIADFLSAFDRKIDNQKAQLEHWKQIKKGLLQQMFV